MRGLAALLVLPFAALASATDHDNRDAAVADDDELVHAILDKDNDALEQLLLAKLTSGGAGRHLC